jgi:hypothetical protein
MQDLFYEKGEEEVIHEGVLKFSIRITTQPFLFPVDI